MIKHITLAVAALALAAPTIAQDELEGAPSPGAIVKAAKPDEWVSIPADELLVMTLAPDAEGAARAVVIQLMPAPFSQGWVQNIRKLARAKWYDNISVNRVQDNYVVQWGDPNYDNPEAEGETKPLPQGLKVMNEGEYVSSIPESLLELIEANVKAAISAKVAWSGKSKDTLPSIEELASAWMRDPYAPILQWHAGWPLAFDAKDGGEPIGWPTHCYGMVGVGRNYSPDTGSGAELYTVIGHAPRHLDRNIALVGRIIEGMEHLSSLPRGKGELGFYADFEKDKRTPILSVRVASDLAAVEQPSFEYLSTESESFAQYAEARANRRDPFFIHPAGGADICNVPVPVRRVSGD